MGQLFCMALSMVDEIRLSYRSQPGIDSQLFKDVLGVGSYGS
jgi:hypothetical protein